MLAVFSLHQDLCTHIPVQKQEIHINTHTYIHRQMEGGREERREGRRKGRRKDDFYDHSVGEN